MTNFKQVFNDIVQTRHEGVWYLLGYLMYLTGPNRFEDWLWSKDLDQYRYGWGVAEDCFETTPHDWG